ncbi:hypothetical protein [Actinomadura hibisca]|uniref:hypothetical protein n=1 Tax=Actinomadura hibisca TaxID=68565 RepID=UPI000831C91B|nr:hypothetical protein [Actinomadura hibisca]
MKINSSPRPAARRWSLAALAVTAVPALAVLPAQAAHAAEIAVASTAVSPNVIDPGQQAVQTVTLTEPAPAGGTVVQLRDLNVSEDLNYAQSTGRKVTVPAGQRSVSFPIRVQSEIGATTTGLRAVVGGSHAETSITVRAQDPDRQAITDFLLNGVALPGTVVAGAAVTGTVKLKAAAPAGGLAVDIRNHPGETAALSTPAYVVVPAGSTTGAFTMKALPDDGPKSVTVTADIGNGFELNGVTVVPKGFSVGALRGLHTPCDADCNPNWGVASVGDLWHPFGAVIKLKSSNPAIKVPASVEIPAGKPSTTFVFQVERGTPVGTTATITATWQLGLAGPVTSQVYVQY